MKTKNIFLAGILAFISPNIYATNPNETAIATYTIVNHTSQNLRLGHYVQYCSTINGSKIGSPVIESLPTGAGDTIKNVISFDPNAGCTPAGYFIYENNESNGCVINYEGNGGPGNWEILPTPVKFGTGNITCSEDIKERSKNNYSIDITISS